MTRKSYTDALIEAERDADNAARQRAWDMTNTDVGVYEGMARDAHLYPNAPLPRRARRKDPPLLSIAIAAVDIAGCAIALVAVFAGEGFWEWFKAFVSLLFG
jgi:hypothetical protein